MPKIVRPLSERFPCGETSLESDAKNWTLTVELTSDERQVRLGQKPVDIDAKDGIANDSNVDVSRIGKWEKASKRREMVEKAKSLLRQMAVSKASVVGETCSEPKEKQSDASATIHLSDDTSDADSVAAHHGECRHGDSRRVITKPIAMETTWKLLDTALIRKAIPHPGKSGDETSVRSVRREKKMFAPNPIPIPLVLKTKERHLVDPRSVKSVTEMADLPIPKFGTTRVFEVGDWQFALKTPEAQTQWPITVVIGAGSVAEPAADGGDDHRLHLMELMERSVRLLHVLSETEFMEFSHEIIKFQRRVVAAVAKHEDSHSA